MGTAAWDKTSDVEAVEAFAQKAGRSKVTPEEMDCIKDEFQGTLHSDAALVLSGERSNSAFDEVSSTLLSPKYWSTVNDDGHGGLYTISVNGKEVSTDAGLSLEVELSLPFLYSKFRTLKTPCVVSLASRKVEVQEEEQEAEGEYDGNEKWCICGQVGDDEKKRRIATCSSKYCKSPWYDLTSVTTPTAKPKPQPDLTPRYHMDCLQLKRLPKVWLCPECEERKTQEGALARTWVGFSLVDEYKTMLSVPVKHNTTTTGILMAPKDSAGPASAKRRKVLLDRSWSKVQTHTLAYIHTYARARTHSHTRTKRARARTYHIGRVPSQALGIWIRVVHKEGRTGLPQHCHDHPSLP
jgi:hypothetical protein